MASSDHLWTQSVALSLSLSLSSWLCAFLCLPSIFVLGYRVTGAVLVCGVPQSPRGPQLHVMVSISLVHSWKESVCMCVRLCVCAHVCLGVSCVGWKFTLGKAWQLFLSLYDSVFYCNSCRMCSQMLHINSLI